jgi:phospholipid/cholesterol/gamma-HCH transport system ATP-binding protein
MPASDEREIVIEGLHKAFDGRPVLQGVDLTIKRGEIVAIVGGSGCGKTVLLQHIFGHHQPDSGRVLVADHESPGSPLRDLATLDEDEMDRIRVHWAIVFQRNALLSGTVFHNLALWPREIHEWDDARIMPLARKALEAVGLDPDAVMHRDREELSGGMAKRVAIARAIVMDPVLVLYDEPTAGLDPEMSRQVHELIRQTHERLPGLGVPRTTLVVTHDTGLLRALRPRVVMLHDGRVRFDGDFSHFLASDDPHIKPYLEQMAFLHEQKRA